MRLHLILAATLSAAFPLSSGIASPPAPVVQPAQVEQDWRIARTLLEETHVGLNWYMPKGEFRRRADAIGRQRAKPVSPRAFQSSLLGLIAALGHGHTTLDPPFKGPGFRLRRLDPAGTYFPAQLRIIDGRLHVATDLSGTGQLPVGAQIVNIDGQPAKALVQRLGTYIGSDGNKRSFRDYQLDRAWRFHDLLDLINGRSATFSLRMRSGGVERAITVPAASPDQLGARFQAQNQRSIDELPPAVQWRMLDDGIAILTVSSFYEGLLAKPDAGFEPDFAKAFDGIRKAGATRLIVDLRGNEGGNVAAAALLYAHLADRPFRFAGPSFVASPKMSTLAYADQPSDAIKAFGATPMEFVERAADGTWRMKPAFDEDRIKEYVPRPEAFTGPLTIVTDGGSFSATNAFLDLVGQFHRGAGRVVRFVGQPNGGDNRGRWESGGQMVTLILPNSGLRLTVPSLGAPTWSATGRPPVRIPDDAVDVKSEDLATGYDRMLAEAISVAR